MPDPILTEVKFPNITAQNYRKTSDRTPAYNCIAHAIGNFNNWWWPHEDAYWPPNCSSHDIMEAFHLMFLSLDYCECQNGSFEEAFEKIALYALNDVPTHAARQVSNGQWSSKLGTYIDIEHSLAALEGPHYGYVVKYYKRQTDIR